MTPRNSVRTRYNAYPGTCEQCTVVLLLLAFDSVQDERQRRSLVHPLKEESQGKPKHKNETYWPTVDYWTTIAYWNTVASTLTTHKHSTKEENQGEPKRKGDVLVYRSRLLKYNSFNVDNSQAFPEGRKPSEIKSSRKPIGLQQTIGHQQLQRWQFMNLPRRNKTKGNQNNMETSWPPTADYWTAIA